MCFVIFPWSQIFFGGWVWQGLSLTSSGNYTEGIVAHRKAVELDTSYKEGWTHLAQVVVLPLISSNRKIFATLHRGSRSMKEYSGILDYLDDFLEIRRIDTAQWNVCGVPLVLAVLQRACRFRQGNWMLTKGGSSWWQVWLSNPISQNPKWLLSLFGSQNTFVGTFHFC